MTRTRHPSSRDVGAYKRALLADPCAYCDAPAVGLDHIEPRDRGGDNQWTNVVGACRHCNSSKSTLTLLGFLGRKMADAGQFTSEEIVSLMTATERDTVVRRAWARCGSTGGPR